MTTNGLVLPVEPRTVHKITTYPIPRVKLGALERAREDKRPLRGDEYEMMQPGQMVSYTPREWEALPETVKSRLRPPTDTEARKLLTVNQDSAIRYARERLEAKAGQLVAHEAASKAQALAAESLKQQLEQDKAFCASELSRLEAAKEQALAGFFGAQESRQGAAVPASVQAGQSAQQADANQKGGGKR